MEFGKTLREAREAKEYTVAQLAEMTHIMSSTIVGLEHEDFSAIAAPIYGRGFVKLCCRALDLDPEPMIKEFMAIYNGEKPAARQIAIAAAPVPESKPEPTHEPEPISEPVPTPEPVPMPEPETPEPITANPPPPPPPPPPPFRLEEAPAEPVRREKPPVSRFAPPQPQDDFVRERSFTMPAIPWRLITLIVGVIAVIWALVAGCCAVYRTLSRPSGGPTNAVRPTVSESAPEPTAVTIPSAPRTAKPVKPLYID